jgi:hypothetical protein
MANIFRSLSDTFQLYKMPVVGNLLPNPAQENQAKNARRAVDLYGAYRPEAAQARMNAMNQRASMYQGSMDTLTAMGGGRQPVNVQDIGKNPMSERMMGMGYSAPATQENWIIVSKDGQSVVEVPPGTQGAAPKSSYTKTTQPGFGTSSTHYTPLPVSKAPAGTWVMYDANGNPVPVPPGTQGAFRMESRWS